MRLLKQDKATGELSLGMDDLDDLWTLRNLIQPGDLVTGDTVRTAATQEEMLRGGKAEKRRMRLGIRAETIEWADFSDSLRVLGTIETGPQDHGRHHTLTFTDEPGTHLNLLKAGGLADWHLDMIRDAAAASKKPRVIIMAIDDSEAQISVLRGHGIQHLGPLTASGQGKRHQDAKAKPAFFDDVVASLKTLRTDPDMPLVVVGPGWWRTEFLEHAAKSDPAVVAGAMTEGTGQGGRGGVQEAIVRGLLNRVQRDGRVALEAGLVEEAFARIAKDALAVYGPDEVRRAVEAGAVETLLVADSLIRGPQAETVDQLIRAARVARAEIRVVATGHEAGARLASLGGLVALTRYNVA